MPHFHPATQLHETLLNVTFSRTLHLSFSGIVIKNPKY
jgi:hypothetical protein